MIPPVLIPVNQQEASFHIKKKQNKIMGHLGLNGWILLASVQVRIL